MLSLIVGGASSGKSAFAETVACAGPAPRTYIATMRARDAESRARVLRHRAQRAGKGFTTLEQPVCLGACAPTSGTVLVDTLGTLVANELFDADGCGADTVVANVVDGVERLVCQCERVVVVADEVASGGTEWDEGTLMYLKALASVTNRLAAMADEVYEVTCGVSVCHKGEGCTL